MNKTLTICAMLLALISTQAQEKLPRDEALKYAFVTCLNLKQMVGTPIPTDPDVKRPVALKDGEYGGMVLPEAKLSAETLAKAGKEVVPVGQLWMLRLAPLSDGQVVPTEKLRMIHLSHNGEEGEVPCCALGVRKNGEGALELLIYGKGQEPVLRAPLKAISNSQDTPIEMSAERTDEGGRITLSFFGKYEASFMVTDPDRY